MAYLTATQIAGYAKQAGFSGNNLITAVAVAMAESSGNASAVNYLGCVGLFQVYGKVWRRTYPTWTNSWLKSPGNNAKAAFIISNGGKNWKPWEAYSTGAYRKYLSQAQAAVRAVGGVSVIVPTKTSPNAPGVTAAKVLSIAASQIGYTERPGNRTKYWTDLNINQGQPWCGGFVTWCLWKSGYSLSKIKSMMGPNPYHVRTIEAYAKKKKRWTQTPKPGYLAVFTYSHVEIVEKVISSKRVVTIGGNTSSGTRGSQNNGGGVYRKPRSGSIKGYVRIDYDAGGAISPTSPDWVPGVDTPKGDINSAGQLVVDGNFNAATSQVLAAYFGFQGTGSTTSSDYWRQIEVVAKFPVRWQNGKLDVETVKFLQWATKQSINGVWNARFIAGMQTFLNEFSAGREPAYITWAGG